MTDRRGNRLIDEYLDDTLAAEQLTELSDWIKADMEHARQFVAAAMLHDRLRGELTLESADADLVRPRSVDRHRFVRPLLALAATACLILIASSVLWTGLGDTPVAAATVELSRIIEAVGQPKDRTYLITAVVAGESSPSAGQSFRRGNKPPIDGALLHVRGPNSYVLIRRYQDGTEFITGSDGIQSWTVPPQGNVRVSSDPQRFRGPVPGQQHAIPFIDMRDNLDRLRSSYDLELISESQDVPLDLAGAQRLVATRKSEASGGPKRIVIWYDRQSKTIQRMLMERLPQAQGGPRSVMLDLVEENDLGPQFFRHTAHHAREREVIHE